MSYLRTIHDQLVAKKLSVKELTTAVLKKLSPAATGNACIDTYGDDALRWAEAVDTRLAKGESLPLGAGIPIGIKDNMCVDNQMVTCGSRMLSGYRSPYTATSVRQLMATGFIPVGRMNMDEFAMGSSNEYSVYGAVDNPWDASRVSGGSSGGSAAIVAAGVLPVSLGSDTGGSIRQPASFCGIAGLKPTYGRVSRYGLVAFASSLDQIGPFGQYVEDVAIVLSSLCGFDPHDSTSEDRQDHDFVTDIQRGSLAGVRVGVPNELMSSTIDADVRAAVSATLTQMEEQGAIIDYFDFSYFDEALATYYVLAPAEASSNLSRFDGVRYGHRTPKPTLKDMIQSSRQDGFGDEVKRRIILGTYVLSSGYYDAYYGKAQHVRGVVTQRYADLFKTYDVICSPTAPTTAFSKGAHDGDPLTMYLSDIATIPVNLAGLPAISIPCGIDSHGLPVGFQMTGTWFSEKSLLQMAHCVETQRGFTPKHAFDLGGLV